MHFLVVHFAVHHGHTCYKHSIVCWLNSLLIITHSTTQILQCAESAQFSANDHHV